MFLTFMETNYYFLYLDTDRVMASSMVTTNKDDPARLPEAVSFFSIFNLFISSYGTIGLVQIKTFNANTKQNCSDRCDRISIQYFVNFNKNDPNQYNRGPEQEVVRCWPTPD